MKIKYTVLLCIILSGAFCSSAMAASFTLDQIAAHNKANDCYLLIAGKVYDVTSYSNLHPGGAEYIINFCGVDSTQAYNTKAGSGVPHSQRADMDLSKYYIGDLAVAAKTVNESSAGIAKAEIPAPPLNEAKQVSLSSKYPLILPIFAVWIIFLAVFSFLSKKNSKVFNKLLLMKIASLSMLVSFLVVGSGGVYMALCGILLINGFNTMILHVYFGFVFVLAALTHVYIHFREIMIYIGGCLRRKQS